MYICVHLVYEYGFTCFYMYICPPVGLSVSVRWGNAVRSETSHTEYVFRIPYICHLPGNCVAYFIIFKSPKLWFDKLFNFEILTWSCLQMMAIYKCILDFNCTHIHFVLGMVIPSWVPMCLLWLRPESFKLMIKKKLSMLTKFWTVIILNLPFLKNIIECKLSFHLHILCI